MTDPQRPAPSRRSLRYHLGHAWLRIFGWRAEGQVPPGGKFVVIAAPHTSNWDLPFALALSYVLDLRINFLMKEAWFRGPMGPFFKWLGGIPVNRSARHNLVDQCVQRFAERDKMLLLVPPEGTRGKTEHWKSGFYWIAHGAKVPILLGFLDYGRKVGGLGPAIMPTGDIVADVEKMGAFYADKQGKFPENTSPVRVQPPRALPGQDGPRPG
ncbi:MAG TPA: lysophospholipid acyltransferase family protein [Myxococcaceae bacterium]|nr:lysophospholipid acyltransferase family protein [Myxococcaceae bacterium]